MYSETTQTSDQNRKICKIDNFNHDLLAVFPDAAKDPLYAKFLQVVLNYVPVDYRSKQMLMSFTQLAHQSFRFFCDTKPELNKIWISVAAQESINKSGPAFNDHDSNNTQSVTHILVHCPDNQFVFDSINSLSEHFPLKTSLTFNAVVKTHRDHQGRCTDIAPASDYYDTEALIYFRLCGATNDELKNKITEEIKSVLKLINEATENHAAIAQKIDTISHGMKHYVSKESEQKEEVKAFLHWLKEGNMTFLSSIDFDSKNNDISNQLGIKEIWQDGLQELKSVIYFASSEQNASEMLILGKINKVSPIKRASLIDYILIKNLDDNGNYIGGTVILGLYRSAIYFQSIKHVPILRKKMEYVLGHSGVPLDTYNSKKIKSILESLPRDLLIQISADDLSCITMHMLSSMRSKKLKLFVQQDLLNSFVNVIIFMRRDKLTTEIYSEISHYLSEKFDSPALADNITVVDQNFVHLFATISLKDGASLPDVNSIEADLIHITMDWHDAVLQSLLKTHPEPEARQIYHEIEHIFPVEYLHNFPPETAVDDIEHIIQAAKSKSIKSSLVLPNKDSAEYFLKIYSLEKSLALSDILPAIENLGFVALDEKGFRVKGCRYFLESWIYQFRLTSKTGNNTQMSLGDTASGFAPAHIDTTSRQNLLKHNIEEALEKIISGEIASDSLSNLVSACGFNWIQVKLIKALVSYLYQTGAAYSKQYVQDVLVKHYQYADLLFQLFEARFNPVSYSPAKQETIITKCLSYLETVDKSSEDKVLASLRLVICAINRTNFYQLDSKYTAIKDYISFKIDSSKVPDLPAPLPYAEIFVYGRDFEAIHLRGGKVARGGIRWSDRGEDYRTEVLGLMKAQMTKNTVIVPVGSKGAFFLHFSSSSMSREEYMARAVECYKNFIRGMLDITDNIIENQTIAPVNMIIYDQEDPYLVVAADKGTATFSDYANSVSQEYNFWLRDAFASGGSAGYDHKKMGITAKGAWISVQSHFKDQAIDVQKQAFTVVGIGDMSGDVFGNGMLLSEYIKLVAAFNHEHIFIDPTPDCKISYRERQRLFSLPRSKWSDYDSKLISKGGGIFERSAKTITISREAKTLLGVTQDTFSPNELIRAILMAKVDLLWNGGIGTYVKAETQNNVEIADKFNDALRVNGKEVGAAVIAEGGNLGLSQLGRIEYALKGGYINTDFIDNSAGVDCSDHEVNIKIALNMAVSSGKLTLEKRNELLSQMTAQVEQLVLEDNYSQNLAITIAQKSPNSSIDAVSHMIGALEKDAMLDRELEFLPSNNELSQRASSGEDITRPELAILLSYSKMALDADLQHTSVIKDAYFDNALLEYFPALMREQFKEEIINHPLKTDIVRTSITNKLVNQLGADAINTLKYETGARSCDIARAYEVANKVLGLQDLWLKVSSLPYNLSANIKMELFANLIKIMRRAISWFVKNIPSPIDINEVIEEYLESTQELAKIIGQFLRGHEKTKFASLLEHYSHAGVELSLARSITTLGVVVSAFDIINISEETGKTKQDTASLYFACGDLLMIDWLRYACEAQIKQDSYWNRLASQSMKDDLYDKQRRIVKHILQKTKSNKALDMTSWIGENQDKTGIFLNFIEEVKAQNNLDWSIIALAVKKLELMTRNMEREVKWKHL